ncbi:MAG: methionine biosynthesis protein MetW [Candidatus Latescibacterota bacterium]
MRDDAVGIEYRLIYELIKAGASVLDLGCGDGELLAMLVREKKIKAQGIEIDEQAIYQCVAKGLSVLHGDIDSGLSDFTDKAFDYVVLSQSFQQVRNPDLVLMESLRVGGKVIVSFPNFTHYRARSRLFFRGKTPVTESLPYQWYDTPNLHFLSISDFLDYIRSRNITVEKSVFVSKNKRVRILPNLFAETGIFLIAEG